MPRLAAAVADTSGQASAKLQVMHDGGQVSVQGTVEANLVLTCQRCFGNLVFPVKADFNLAWVRSEKEATGLPDVYEPLLSGSGRVKIADLIEDELLLALPMAALHTVPQDCGVGARSTSRRAVTDAKEKRRKPFAALESLKHR
ncbi:MAG TPA: YceD family protein [Gammaproteobacteria bacterium]|nr:YceD family protein [Gammaproteobacteria bacterium]